MRDRYVVYFITFVLVLAFVVGTIEVFHHFVYPLLEN